MYNEDIKTTFLKFAKEDIEFSDDAIESFVEIFKVTEKIETSISKDVFDFGEDEVKILLEMSKSYPIELIKRLFMWLETYHIWYWRDFVCSDTMVINPFSEEIVMPLIEKLSFN